MMYTQDFCDKWLHVACEVLVECTNRGLERVFLLRKLAKDNGQFEKTRWPVMRLIKNGQKKKGL